MRLALAWLLFFALSAQAQVRFFVWYGDRLSDMVTLSNGIVFPSMTISNVPILMTSGVLAPDSMLTNGLIAGAIEFGSPTNQHTFFATTYKVRRSISLGQNVILSDVTVTNTANATSNTAIYSVVMAANYLTVGKVIEPQLDGVAWQANNVNTFSTVQAWINDTNLLLTIPMVNSTSITAGPWQLNFRFTCRTNPLAPSSFALIGKCLETQAPSSGATAISEMDSIVTPVVFDPTVNNTISVTVSNRVAGGGFCSLRLQEGRTLCIDSVPGQ